MKTQALTLLALCASSPAFAVSSVNDIPAECKNLALMQTQLLSTHFYNSQMGGGKYNPAQLVLKGNNGFYISKVEYVGGDGEGQDQCEKDPSLCTNPADAGGAIEWDRLTISAKSGQDSYDAAEVIVSMGSRGGCSISSAKSL